MPARKSYGYNYYESGSAARKIDYIYDDKKHRLLGKETGKTFKIGDKLKVKLIRADIKLKEIDFMIV